MQNPEKCQYRSFILISFKAGKSASDISNDLKKAYVDTAPSLMTVYRWINRFRDETEDIKDYFRSGPPNTACTQDNINIVKLLIEENPHISYRQIEAHVSCCKYTIGKIIKDHLFLRKITSRWVPYDLKEEHKAKRVTFCKANLALFNSGKWRLSDILTGD